MEKISLLPKSEEQARCVLKNKCDIGPTSHHSILYAGVDVMSDITETDVQSSDEIFAKYGIEPPRNISPMAREDTCGFACEDRKRRTDNSVGRWLCRIFAGLICFKEKDKVVEVCQ